MQNVPIDKEDQKEIWSPTTQGSRSALCIDLIGPYVVKEQGKKKLTLQCLTMIDPATRWFEIAELPNKRSDVVANALEQQCFSWYPWPRTVIHDRGTEFMAEVHEMFRKRLWVRR